MNTSRRDCFASWPWSSRHVAIPLTSKGLLAADGYVPFDGAKTTWHEGFDRFDFIMDDATGAITPMTAPASEVTGFSVDIAVKDGKRRCVVVVPKKAAPGNPWSWRGCYWNHEPQTEVELLKRGFHIAFVAPDSRQARQSVGHVVQLPHGEAWVGEQGRFHRNEQRRGE